MQSIYEQMKEAGVEIEHHASDMYVPVNETTKAILRDSRWQATTFRSYDGSLWYDIPFGFDPYWQKKTRRAIQ